METLTTLKNRWKDRRVFQKVSKVFKMWYGITTNIECVVDLPKDVTNAMFNILRNDIEDFLRKELNYCPVENEGKSKMAVILFEQNDKDLVQGFQIFVKVGEAWLTKVGRNQRIEELENIKLTGNAEYLVISPEWMERTEKTITDSHEIGKVFSKEVHPSKTEILYFA